MKTSLCSLILILTSIVLGFAASGDGTLDISCTDCVQGAGFTISGSNYPVGNYLRLYYTLPDGRHSYADLGQIDGSGSFSIHFQDNGAELGQWIYCTSDSPKLKGNGLYTQDACVTFTIVSP